MAISYSQLQTFFGDADKIMDVEYLASVDTVYQYHYDANTLKRSSLDIPWVFKDGNDFVNVTEK